MRIGIIIIAVNLLIGLTSGVSGWTVAGVLAGVGVVLLGDER